MKEFKRRTIKENYARKRINPVLNTANCLIRDGSKIRALGEETTDETILVFIGATFKG